MNEKKMNELIGEIIHIACGAELAIDEQIKMQAIGDIYAAAADALREAGHGLPVAEKVKGEGQGQGEKVYHTPQHVLDFMAQVANVPFADQADPAFLAKIAEKFKLVPNDPRGIDKFLTVAEGVKLVRFRGKDETRLVARRVGKNGNANTIFEIKVDHKDRYAEVFRDGTLMYSIQGETIGHSFVEKLTISSLHRYFKKNKQTNENRKRKRARKAAEKAQGGDALPTVKEVA